MVKPKPIPPKPGQESVWDYPRPPRVEPTSRLLRVEFNGVVVAKTNQGMRVLETAGAPVYYFPPKDVDFDYLVQAKQSSLCEWKGRAIYFDVRVGERVVSLAAWSYPEPVERYEAIRGHVAFYAQKMDACFVESEKARPQPGPFYGGWVTDDIVGPIKGAPGTEHW